MDPLLVRVFDVDFYMTSPVPTLDVTFSNFRGNAVYQVPVLRIFGSTESDEKICVHIHGVFPYFYVPFDGSEPANSLMHKIAINLDRALNISLGQTSSTNQHIYKISLVSGIPLYGYHSKNHQFFKIYMYNPMFVKRANNLLFNESVLGGKIYQPHETHLNFTLQFMIDFNLHGMSNAAFSQAKFRRELNSLEPFDGVLEKVSLCAFECDVLSEHILNRKEVESGHLAANPGIRALWEDEQQRRRNKSENSQLSHFLSLEKTNIAPTESHQIFRETLKQRLQIISQEKVDENFNSTSVYPAETPRNENVGSCSLLEHHSMKSTPTYDPEYLFECSSLNETLNLTLDEDMQNLVDILGDLENNKEHVVEDDCALSQNPVKNDEEDDEIFESTNLLDETIKLTQICNEKTPVKLNIPQIDGSNEIAISKLIHGEKTKKQLELNRNWTVNIERSTKCRKQGKNMPDLFSDEEKGPFSTPTVNFPEYEVKNQLKKVTETVFKKTRKKGRRKRVRVHKKNVQTTGDVQKFIEKSQKNFKLVQHSKPVFKIIPAERPYKLKFGFKRNLVKLLNAQLINEAKFWTSVHSTFEKHVVCDRKILENCKLKKRRKYLFLDGANDDPNEDENVRKSVKKSGKKGKMNNFESNYTSLPIFERKTSTDSATNFQNEQSESKGGDNIQRIKRKINFTETEGTIVEEDLVDCSLTKQEIKPNLTHEITPKITEESTRKNRDETDLSTSAIYDIINDYDPQEGCSNFIQRSPGFSSTFTVEKPHIFPNSGDIFQGSTPEEEPQSTFKKPQYKPPTFNDVLQNMASFNIPKNKSVEPFYGNVADVTGALEVGLNVLKLKSKTSADLTDFQSNFCGLKEYREEKLKNVENSVETVENPRYFYCGNETVILKPVKRAPSRAQVKNWMKIEVKRVEEERKKLQFTTCGYASEDSMDLNLTLTPLTPESSSVQEVEVATSGSESTIANTTPSTKSRSKRKRKVTKKTLLKSAISKNKLENSGNISYVSMNNTFGFESSVQNYQNCKVFQGDSLRIFGMELHCNTRGNLKPDPEYDEICAIFYAISTENCGAFIVGNQKLNAIAGCNCKVEFARNEVETIEKFISFLREVDPDILIGYEIQMASWGYLIERSIKLKLEILQLISRVKDKNVRYERDNDLRVTGRVVLDFWRLLRHEIPLQSYTIQSVVYELLHVRIPRISHKKLSDMFYLKTSQYKVVNYYNQQLVCILKLLEQLDFIGRTSELARLFGIQFFEVLSRGSQFRVESMMLRLAKPLNYVAVSPSVAQRAKMRAPEHIALVLEPESKLYSDPVIVLDFQSLYPSIIIAYNYCFSTCIGRVELINSSNNPFEFGVTSLRVSKERASYLLRRNLLNFSPNGVGFVKKSVRDGILPRMLREILDTRLMVKNSMKENKGDAVLQKVLHNRQLGLKLIANVTYGYTAANFSGRMPSVELGDGIVSKARETLQRTIALVDGNSAWGARVVYGDTDSLFVHCPGKTREEAFKIGAEIVAAVSETNPDPIKLKLEKVYQPCILQTKKRYVGYMYENAEQATPVYDAKGIETVRRDGVPAVSKMLEKSLRILFETKDVSNVKSYVLAQFNKIITGRISMAELTFAKEFRGFTGYKPGACVPSLELARKWVAVDRRAEPRRGERVKYVIINGPPGLPLIKLVRSPFEVLQDPCLKLNSLYYITRLIIPALNRCLNLIGADVNVWFHEMPRKQLQALPIIGNVTNGSPTKKSTISQYFTSTLCVVCGTQTLTDLCENCVGKKQETVTVLSEKMRNWETARDLCKLICSSCTGNVEEICNFNSNYCVSLDCPVLYKLEKSRRDLQQAEHVRMIIERNFELF